MIDLIKFLEVMELAENDSYVNDHKKASSLSDRFKKLMDAGCRRLINQLPQVQKDSLLRKQVRLPRESCENITIKIARTKEDLEQAFALVHDSYADSGSLPPQFHGLHTIPQYTLPSTVTIVAKQSNQVIGTATIVRDNPLGLPVESCFNVCFLRKKLNVAEIYGYSVKGSSLEESRTVAFLLLKFIYAFCRQQGFIDAIVLKADRQYKDMLQSAYFFQDLPAQPASEKDFMLTLPGVGMYLVLDEFERKAKEVYGNLAKDKNLYSFLVESEGDEPENCQEQYPSPPQHLAFEGILPPDLLQYFFQKKTGTFFRITPRERQAIINAYPFPEYEDALPQLTSSPESETSRAPRLEVHNKVTVLDLDHQQILQAHALDISLTGVRVKIKSPTEIPPERCRLQFNLGPQFKTITLDAHLVWNKDSTCGFELQRTNALWSAYYYHLEARFRGLLEPLRQGYSH